MDTALFVLRRMALAIFAWLRALGAPVTFGVNAIVEDGEGRVLLVKQSYTRGWLLPGGGVGLGEDPVKAILRELREEIGLESSAPPEFMSLFTRKLGWTTNLIALYRVREAKFTFRPNWGDPQSPVCSDRRAARRHGHGRAAPARGNRERRALFSLLVIGGFAQTGSQPKVPVVGARSTKLGFMAGMQ